MELNITFQNINKTRIPIDYNYYLSSWIYSVIQAADEEYARFLHNEGFTVDGKQKTFKHFCFGKLRPSLRYDIDHTTKELILEGSSIGLNVRFLIPEAMKKFVSGLFKGQMLQIKNGYDQYAIFPVEQIHMIAPIVIDDTMRFTTLGPILIGKKREDGSDEYLSPDHEDYERLYLLNLADKVRSSHVPWQKEWEESTWSFKLLTPQDKIKSKLHTIKPGKENIQLKGYLFDFELTAPREAIEVGYYGGFGRYCSEGFGSVAVKKQQKENANE